MLALKVSVEAGKSPKKKPSAQRTLVFDEIDIGIGGRAAEAVGRKLKTLAQSTQVLCITHLPQIASFADHHYLIEKIEAGGRTRTAIKHLSDTGRREEVARMLSGATLTDAQPQTRGTDAEDECLTHSRELRASQPIPVSSRSPPAESQSMLTLVRSCGYVDFRASS